MSQPPHGGTPPQQPGGWYPQPHDSGSPAQPSPGGYGPPPGQAPGQYPPQQQYPQGSHQGHYQGYPQSGPAHGPAPTSSAPTVIGLVLALAGVIAAVSPFLSWVSDGSQSITGMDLADFGAENSDGPVTLVCGVVIVVLGLLFAFVRSGVARLVFAIMALLAALLTAYAALVNITDIPSGLDAGLGLYLAAVGGVLGVLAAVAGVVKRR